MARNAKVYETARGKFYIQLYWKGKQWRRFHYDDKWSNMPYRELADRIAEAINADIEKKKMAFDPRQWFKTPGYEFQFALYADKWLSRNTHYAPSVIRDVNRYVGFFIEHFEKTDLREIRKADIRLFVEQGIPPNQKTGEPLAPHTISNILILLHKLLQDAVDDEMIDRVPGFPKITVPESEVKWITREWQDKIIAEIPERDRPIFIFLATWGCRPGEGRALMWDCVDFDKEIITIRRTFSGAGCNNLREYTKTKRVRFLPFTDTLAELFKRIRGLGGFVFRNTRGRPYTADISRTWNMARDRITAPSVTLNQGTRHSFATQHLDSLDIVRQVLGHTRTDMTRKYQGLNMDKIRELGE